MVGCVVAYDGIDFDGVFNVVFILFYFILFLYLKITMVGGNRWIWIMAIVDVGCGHGSDSE